MSRSLIIDDISMLPILTICIPTYNRCADLKQLLDSVVKHGDHLVASGAIEVVISDNASSDNTDTMVNEYAARISRLTYVKNELNIGFAGNLNQSIKIGSADYCWLMGSDEIILPEAFALILEGIFKNSDIIIGNALTRGKERHFFKENGPSEFFIKSRDDFIKFLESCTEISSAFAFISTLVVKRQFWDFPLCTEWELLHPYTHMLRLCRAISARDTTILYIDRPLVSTGQNVNEFNSSILPHFELDLLTIKYIGEEIFYDRRKDVLMAYGKIFSAQYKAIEVIKARVECSEARWISLRSMLLGFGYEKLIINKKAYDIFLLFIYKASKKIKLKISGVVNK